MTDEVLDEVQEDAGDATAPPVPEVPSSAVGGSAEFDAAAFEGRLDALGEKLSVLDNLDDLVDARFKSGKDKRYAKVEEIYDWVKRSGGDPEVIQGDLEISELRQRLEAVESGGAGGTAPVVDAQTQMSGDATTILRDAGIAFNDPEYLQLVESNPGVMPNQWRTIMGDFVDRRATKDAKAEGITESAAISEGGTPPGEETPDSLAAELGQLKQLPTTRENMIRRREILAKMGSQSSGHKAGQGHVTVVG